MGRKSVDRGNKRRLFRNFVRFVKHPIGYVAWRLARFQMASTPRALVALFGITFIAALIDYKQTSNEIKKYDDLLLAYGKNVEGMSGRYIGYHNQAFLKPPTFFDNLFRTPITPDQIIISPAWKGNLRK